MLKHRRWRRFEDLIAAQIFRLWLFEGHKAMNKTTNQTDKSITPSVDALRSIVAQNLTETALPTTEAKLRAELTDVLEAQTRIASLSRDLADRQSALVSKLRRKVTEDCDAAHDLANRLQSARGALCGA